MICRRLAALAVVAGLVGAGCSGGNAASAVATQPEWDPKGQTKCGVKKSQSRPLIVEWPSADRQDLEVRARRGLVAVRYVGCDMELLPRCNAPGRYAYTATERKQDRVSIRDEDDLYANVPLGAAKLESKLQRAGELNVTMTLVGKYEADRGTVKLAELDGDCASATHVITALSVGAFEFYAGADAAVGGGATVAGIGAGAHSASQHDTLNRDGDEKACEKATRQDKEPPEGCAAMLRIEVVPVERPDAPPPSRAAETPSPPSRAAAPPPATAPPRSASAPSAAARPATATTDPGAAIRDTRRSTAMYRAPNLLTKEIEALTKLLADTKQESPDRPKVLRRLAEDYVELRAASSRDPAAASKASAAAIKYYTTIANEYPSFGTIDEVLYDLAYEYERVSDLSNARKVYYQLIQKTPNSRFVPLAYLAFGDLFFNEAQGDPAKWPFAEQAYKENLKYPTPDNKAYAYAKYKLAIVHERQSQDPQALAQLSDAARAGVELDQPQLVDAALAEMVPAYARVGMPAKAYSFFKRAAGDKDGAEKRVLDLLGALAAEYAARDKPLEALMLLSDVLARDEAGASCGSSARAKAFAKIKESSDAKVQSELARVKGAYDAKCSTTTTPVAPKGI